MLLPKEEAGGRDELEFWVSRYKDVCRMMSKVLTVPSTVIAEY